ncbi:MAG: hypothetical protein Kow00121_50000 [Elainellaceae cyanobacterium]
MVFNTQQAVLIDGMSIEQILLSILTFLAFGLLLAVSGGVIYLTTVEWRDRRRQDREKRGR